jgi:hypothetical protein
LIIDPDQRAAPRALLTSLPSNRGEQSVSTEVFFLMAIVAAFGVFMLVLALSWWRAH